MSEQNRHILTELRDQIARHFNLEELQDLASELNLDWVNFPGHTKNVRIQSLLIHLAKSRRLSRLIVILQQKRPTQAWPTPPPPRQQPQLAYQAISVPIQATTTLYPHFSQGFWPQWEQFKGRPWLFWPSLMLGVLTVLALFCFVLISAGAKVGPSQDYLYRWGLLSRFSAEGEGETLIIIAPARRPEGITDEVYDQIQSTIEDHRARLGLENIRVEIEPAVVVNGDRQTAASVGDQYNASLIVWGSSTRDTVAVNFLSLRQPDLGIVADLNAEGLAELAQPDTNVQFILPALPDQLSFLTLLALGQALYLQAEFDQAISLTQTAINFVGDRPIFTGLDAAYFQLGYLHQINQQPDQAIADYSRAIQHNPQAAAAFYNRGVAYADLGQVETAIADYDQAVQLNPQDARIFNHRGNAYLSLGDIEAALADYNSAVRLNPHDAGAFYNRANVRADLGQAEAALADYNQAIQLDPQDARTFNNRGIIYIDLGDPEAALADYNQAIQLNPRYGLAYNNRGNAYRNLGNFEAALADYNQAIQFDPHYANAYNNRGAVYAQLGQYEAALTDFDRALALDPQLQGAFYFRGIAHADLGQYEAAVADFDQALALDAQFAAAFYHRGIAYNDLGQVEAALADFERAIQLGFQDADLFRQRGTIYYNLGRVELALADFQHYLALVPNTSSRPQLESLIQQLQAELSP